MDDVLTRNWWAVALRGVAALIFGLLTMFNPRITLAVLVLFFGAYALANGVFALDWGLRDRLWRCAYRARRPAAELGPGAGRARNVAHVLIALARVQERCRGQSPGLIQMARVFSRHPCRSPVRAGNRAARPVRRSGGNPWTTTERA